MPEATLSPAVHGQDASDGPTQVVHTTRRARIEAERAAAKQEHRRAEPERAPSPVAAVPTAATAAGSPVTPPAPSSPAMPVSAVDPVTPPAPSSPVVAPAAVQAATAAPAAGQGATTAPAAAPAVDSTRPARRVSGQVPSVRRRPAAPAAGQRVDRATRHLGAGRTAAPSTRSGRTGASFRTNASRVTAVGALLFAAGLVVSTSLPAQALYTPEPGSTTVQAVGSGDTQSVRVGDAAAVPTDRDAYTVSDATQYKNLDSSSFTNDPKGTIQWPFLTGVPITSGFGGRQVEGCSFCSTNHQGVDFAPGAGTPIRVIAAGTVIKVQPHDGGFGNDVWVEHDVDGKQFTSVYGHMMDNSFKVVKGQQVAVGDELGLVGSTGNSTGPHLHLEVHVDGVPVDPLAWLKANAN